MDNQNESLPLAALTTRLETEVKQARKEGDISALLAITNAAMDQLEQFANLPGCSKAERQSAQRTAKKFGYNAAADAWPAWEFPPPERTAAELAAGWALARRAARLVEALPPEGKQSGNAAWLIGAFELAMGNVQAAREQFRSASDHFSAEPEMKLLADGYRAIAGDETVPPLGQTVETLAQSGLPHAGSLAEQLITAGKVFRK